ncbi:MAG: hypothetical protein WBW62_05340, partial [Solirubrobacterales bacterium]
FPVTLDPKSAAIAAMLLRASLAVPIHYGGIDEPGLYEPVTNASEAFTEATGATAVESTILKVGEILRWPEAVST